MRLTKTLLGAIPALTWLLEIAPAAATPPSDCDTDSEAQVAVVYNGATSINATLRRAVAALCIQDANGDGTVGVESQGSAPGGAGDFVERLCGPSNVNQTIECKMDLNGDGTAETCVAYYTYDPSSSPTGSLLPRRPTATERCPDLSSHHRSDAGSLLLSVTLAVYSELGACLALRSEPCDFYLFSFSPC